jgi:hypothetical protein
MKAQLSILEKLQQANRLITEVLGEAPQLYDCHLDQALLVLVLAMKRARRSPKLRRSPQPQPFEQPNLPLF